MSKFRKWDVSERKIVWDTTGYNFVINPCSQIDAGSCYVQSHQKTGNKFVGLVNSNFVIERRPVHKRHCSSAGKGHRSIQATVSVPQTKKVYMWGSSEPQSYKNENRTQFQSSTIVFTPGNWSLESASLIVGKPSWFAETASVVSHCFVVLSELLAITFRSSLYWWLQKWMRSCQHDRILSCFCRSACKG